jgi:pilus assembly protein Flp/PilA
MLWLSSLMVALRMHAIEREDRGATATEYALLVAFIALAIVVAVGAFGSQLSTFFSGLAAQVGIL